MTQHFQSYSDIIHLHAEERSDKAALIHRDECIPYPLLEENINRFGNILKSLGVKTGDGVLIALPDCPEAFYAFLGGMKYGARPILLSPYLHRGSYEYVLRDAEPAVLITVRASEAASAAAGSASVAICLEDRRYADLWEKAGDVLTPAPPSENGVDFLLYTSGSTGEPKGAPHSQADMLFCAEQYAGQVLKMTGNDVILSASRLHFAYGLGNSLIMPLYHGASVILNPGPAGPADVFQVLELITERRPTIFFAVPSFYNMMLRTISRDVRLSSLRMCVSAGEALPAGLFGEWKQLTGMDIIDGLGSTEALHIFISNRPDGAIPGATGFVVPGYQAKLIGEDGALVSSGRPGALLIRGGSTSPFYWNRPELTAENMLDDGWLSTGDIFIEQNGCYFYQGRRDDMFKSGGGWVSPTKVEEILRGHPAVLECAVTSCDIEGLRKPLAHVVLKAGYEDETGLAWRMRSFIMERLPSHMCPVRFIFTETIPKTETGKIQRSALR